MATTAATLAGVALGSDQHADHRWLTGKIVDENRARYLATIYHSGQSSTTTNGSVSATGRSTTNGDDTTTNVNGSYSGTSSTNYSGSDMPMYKVYENFIIEGDDMVYVTQERMRWRWSKAAHVTVNGEVKYYVDKRKLHVLDDEGKEHVIEIVKQIQKDRRASTESSPAQTVVETRTGASSVAPSQPAHLQVSSNPDAADIEIDGRFVGNTPLNNRRRVW